MQNTWLSLLPPLIVLVCAFITRRLHLSLAIGLITGCLIAASFSLPKFIQLITHRMYLQISDIDTLYTYSFLILISITIILISRTGGINAFAQVITQRLNNTKKVETASLLLSFMLFIDDYLSNLTVGYIMRPLTNRFNIPRAKLAFLVHSLSGPLVILVPISSWVAMITSQLDQTGIAPQAISTTRIIADPFFIYVQSIPFIFYSFFIILSVWFIVQKRISFGPMHTHEQIAQTTGNLFGGKKPPIHRLEDVPHAQGTIADLVVPLITLISCVVIGIPYAGGYYLLGGNRTLIEAFKKNDQTFFVLFAAGCITLGISLILALTRRMIAVREMPRIVINGITLMIPAILMLFLASTLGTVLRLDLLTGNYLAEQLLGSFNIMLLPVMFFIISAITATITGSSWGTIALMLPIAIPMLTSLLAIPLPTTPNNLLLLFPSLGAIFSGAVCGDHISPISETTIMASTSSGCYPIDHAQTQFPYAAPALICSGLAFLVSGLLMHYNTIINVSISFGIGITVCFSMLYLADKLYKKRV